MYRVLLADDEPWIIEGLKASIDWESEGFVIDRTAENGPAADQLLQEDPPDLALIDIRMPGLNGLEVIRKNKKRCPNTFFVIISGYSEFEYARAGIEMNVFGYLLKPLDEEELLALVRRIRTQLDATLATRESALIYNDLEADTGYLSKRYPAGCHLCLQVGGSIDDIPGAACRVRIRPGHYLLISPVPFDLDEAALPSSVLGVGCMEYRGGSLYECLPLLEPLAYSFFVCTDRRIFSAENAPSSVQEVAALQAAITANDPERIASALQQLRSALSQTSVGSLIQLYSAFSGETNYSDLERIVHRCGSACNLLNELEAVLFRDPASVDGNASSYTPSEYVREHYCEDISFIDLCTRFSLSASAMRTQIHRETGMTFTQYLNHLRMVHASELLKSSDFSINEIAASCGFIDSLYFRKVFKRHFHVTPSEFRTETVPETQA